MSAFLRCGCILRVQITRVSRAVGEYRFPASYRPGETAAFADGKGRLSRGGTRFSRENLRPNCRGSPEPSFFLPRDQRFQSVSVNFPPAFGAATTLSGKRMQQLRTRQAARWRNPRGRGRDSDQRCVAVEDGPQRAREYSSAEGRLAKAGRAGVVR
jgi:hypothetical protein